MIWQVSSRKKINIFLIIKLSKNKSHIWNLRSTRVETTQDHIGSWWNIHILNSGPMIFPLYLDLCNPDVSQFSHQDQGTMIIGFHCWELGTREDFIRMTETYFITLFILQRPLPPSWKCLHACTFLMFTSLWTILSCLPYKLNIFKDPNTYKFIKGLDMFLPSWDLCLGILRVSRLW